MMTKAILFILGIFLILASFTIISLMPDLRITATSDDQELGAAIESMEQDFVRIEEGLAVLPSADDMADLNKALATGIEQLQTLENSRQALSDTLQVRLILLQEVRLESRILQPRLIDGALLPIQEGVVDTAEDTISQPIITSSVPVMPLQPGDLSPTEIQVVTDLQLANRIISPGLVNQMANFQQNLILSEEVIGTMEQLAVSSSQFPTEDEVGVIENSVQSSSDNLEKLKILAEGSKHIAESLMAIVGLLGGLVTIILSIRSDKRENRRLEMELLQLKASLAKHTAKSAATG